MKISKPLIGHIAIFSANIFFALNVPNIKYIINLGEVPTLAINYIRIGGGAILFWIVSLFFKSEKVARKDLFLIFLASFFGVQFNKLTFIIASNYTSPIDISIIATLIPILTMCMASIFLREPITWKKVLGIIIGACGALIVIFTTTTNPHTASNPILGNLLFLLSCMIFASYLTIFKPVISRYQPLTFMKWMFLFAAICQLPICFKSLTSVDFNSLSINTLWALTYAVFGASFAAYVLLACGQKILRPTIVSMYNYMQPFIVFVVALMLGQDTFDYRKLCAAILVIIGVFIVTQSKAKK